MISTAILSAVLSFVKTVSQVGISIGALLLLGLYSFQGKLIYPASLNDGHGHCSTPDEYDMDYELVSLQTADGETLQCYLLKHNRTDPHYSNKTVLILCPNAGNIGHSLPIVSIFYKKFGYNVFIYSYRGYGKSTGSPSETGLKIDANTVMEHISQDPQLSESSLVLYGRSLGGAVAIYIAATSPSAVHGLILENTFLLIRKTVPHIFPSLRYFASFVHQKWNLELLVPTIPSNIPVIMFSARRDEIVPPLHMDTINQLLASRDKAFHKFENSMHNDTVSQDGYWALVQQFIQDKVNPVGY